MNQNLWLRYALYSFFGVLVLMAVNGLMQNSMFNYYMPFAINGMNNMQSSMQTPMQGMSTNMGFAGEMSMNGMNMQAPMQMPMQGMAANMGFVGQMPMNGGMTEVYPSFNGSIMSVMPVSIGHSYIPVQQVVNGIPVNGIQPGDMIMNVMPMISVPVISIPMNTYVAPMHGATMSGLGISGVGFNSLPMIGM